MKKIVVFLFSVLMVMVVAVGCSSSNETKAESDTKAATEEKTDSKETSEKTPSVTYKDGTYEGISDTGMHAGLKVSVVVKDGKIAEVNVVEHGETEGIGTQAIEKLPVQIVEAQSTDVDPVSGASSSSAAIKDAVDQALSQAK